MKDTTELDYAPCSDKRKINPRWKRRGLVAAIAGVMLLGTNRDFTSMIASTEVTDSLNEKIPMWDAYVNKNRASLSGSLFTDNEVYNATGYISNQGDVGIGASKYFGFPDGNFKISRPPGYELLILEEINIFGKK